MDSDVSLPPEEEQNELSDAEKIRASSNSVKSLENSFSETAEMTELEGKKIFLVEDDEFLLGIISRKFTTTRCVFSHAATGEDALKMIFADVPDVVLLDIMLPGIDGFEVLKQIKENEKTKNIPVIMLSNLSQQKDIDRSKALGAARFLTKAIYDLDEIIREIKAVLATEHH